MLIDQLSTQFNSTEWRAIMIISVSTIFNPPPLQKNETNRQFKKKLFSNLLYFFLLHFFPTNLLVWVKLGYTLNFTALGHLEVPQKFLMGGGVVGGKSPIIIITLHLVELSWNESLLTRKKSFLTNFSFIYFSNFVNPQKEITIVSNSNKYC